MWAVIRKSLEVELPEGLFSDYVVISRAIKHLEAASNLLMAAGFETPVKPIGQALEDLKARRENMKRALKEAILEAALEEFLEAVVAQAEGGDSR
ncbi:hypothetical protein [Clavavirus yamagawaense]|uniref:Uncharacterized protein n=1 Tax=Aeropyrum pernix bacilliform virus 1 (isolate -/Japan/Tanaka/2005) TaxID=1289471 RepID=D4QF67_APBV1|nr:hypothetical protein FK791_gp01 [Aeropyrum pernix bacilliform virus 1]BAJ06111.1 hypothetical protein [Aeropyrum pernix bacilliform virus 1]